MRASEPLAHLVRPLDLVWIDRHLFFDRASMRPGPAILDVGGMTPERIRRITGLLPGAGITTYEAGEAAHAELSAHRWPRAVQVRRAALAAVTGTLHFYVFERRTMSALAPWHKRGRAELLKIEHVPSRTLSQMIHESGMGIVDLLFLNCEGAELSALIEIANREDLSDRVRQICVSFHCSSDHLPAYPPEVRDGIIAALAQRYIVIPGQRHCQYFLFVHQPRV